MRLAAVSAVTGAALALPALGAAQPSVLPEAPTLPAPELPGVPGLPDVSDVVDVVEQPPIPDPTGGAPLPPAPLVSGTGESSSSSPSGEGAGGTSSSSPSRERTGRSSSQARDSGPRTRFDRLPLRFERLLERILRGRNVAANLRRLEAALVRAPARLRARVLRLVRSEIEALERGGVTAAERRRIERLRRVEELVERSSAGGGRRGSAGPGGPTATVSWSPRADGAAASAGETGERKESHVASGASPPAPAKDESRGAGALPALPALPGLPDGVTLGTFLLVLVGLLVALGALAFALAALPSRVVPGGRARHALRRSRADLAFLGLVALAATMLLLLLGAFF